MFDSESPVIALGTRIVYYHEKTGFASTPLQRAFPQLTPEEAFAVRAGDVLYVDPGSLRRGKYRVWGWVKGIVTGAHYVHAQRWKISYLARNRRGSCYVELDGFCPDLSRPDETKLLELIRQHPRCLQI